MHRLLVAAGLTIAIASPASAQSWVPWNQPNLLERYGNRGRAETPPPPVAKVKPKKGRTVGAHAVAPRVGGRLAGQRPIRTTAAPAGLTAPAASAPAATGPGAVSASLGPAQAPLQVVSGGPRPEISARGPKSVHISTGKPVGSIVIDTAARRLYLVTSASRALSYPVSVGREGFSWTGTEKITRMADWPDWHPPAEMRERDPKLPVKMTGGLYNPLGAKALYLGNSLYRIHGTSNAKSIGRAASSGCFRMHNAHVVDLASRVGVGTRVIVTRSLGARTASAAPPRRPKVDDDE